MHRSGNRMKGEMRIMMMKRRREMMEEVLGRSREGAIKEIGMTGRKYCRGNEGREEVRKKKRGLRERTKSSIVV